jgi:hypothetical protein
MKSFQELLDRAAEYRTQAATARDKQCIWALIALAEEFELQAKEIEIALP